MDLSKDDLDDGADNQSIMFEYATDETENGVLVTGLMATRLEKKWSNARENGDLWWMRPHGKTQVTIEHVQGTDGSLDPRKIRTVVTRKNNFETVMRDVVKNIRVDSGSVKDLITDLINKVQSEIAVMKFGASADKDQFARVEAVITDLITWLHTAARSVSSTTSNNNWQGRQCRRGKKNEKKTKQKRMRKERNERRKRKVLGEKEEGRETEKTGWEGRRMRRKKLKERTSKTKRLTRS